MSMDKSRKSIGIQEMTDKTRGEQRFGAITYRLIARWTGLKLSTVQSYGGKRVFDPNDIEAALSWVHEHCKQQGRPYPWQRLISQQDRIVRKLGFWCYKDYLKSDLWQQIREAVQGPCYRCGGDANTVHHKKYTIENMRGDTTKGLARVCGPCHLSIHNGKLPADSIQEYSENPENIPTGHLGSETPGPVSIAIPVDSGYNPRTGGYEE